MQTLTRQQEFIETLENNPLLTSAIQVRDLNITYATPNKRLLLDAAKIPTIEPDLLDWIDTLPRNAVLYDVGASNGPFSVYAAMKGLQVVAFEPEIQNLSILEMNHFLNRGHIPHPILALNMALSDTQGLGKIYCRNYVAGAHMKMLDAPLRRMELEPFDVSHIQWTLKETLDTLVPTYQLPFPVYLKVDVDGAEDKLLKGAEKTLQHPDFKELFIEIAYPEERSKPIMDYIESLGFRLKSQALVENYEGLYNCLFVKNTSP